MRPRATKYMQLAADPSTNRTCPAGTTRGSTAAATAASASAGYCANIGGRPGILIRQTSSQSTIRFLTQSAPPTGEWNGNVGAARLLRPSL